MRWIRNGPFVADVDAGEPRGLVGPHVRAVRFRPAETGSSGSGTAAADRAATSASIIGANIARPSP